MPIDRRGFITGGAATVAALPLSATLPALANERMIINALGSLSNPNTRLVGDTDMSNVQPQRERLDPRAIADAQSSGTSAVNVTLGYVAGPMPPFEYTVEQLDWWDEQIRANPLQLIKVERAEDILTAQRTGRVGIIYGFQNGAMLGDDVNRVHTFAERGVRVLQLTYNGANQLGHGSMAENLGLTSFGRNVVAALNEANMLVDLSHSGERTCLDAIEMSSAPIAITHTGCRALADLPRNKSDHELKQLATRGGVAGIYFMPFLRVHGQPMATDVADHVQHALKVCGEDHVGIGTDGSFTAIDDMSRYREVLAAEVESRKKMGIGATGESADVVPFVPDMQGPEQFDVLVGELTRRGVSGRVIDKILGGNFYRLMSEIWG